jgi:hypothetical protein
MKRRTLKQLLAKRPAELLMSIENKVRRAAEVIKAADALLITAGAGMGVDSGLPDFRGAQGFWRAYPVIAKRAFHLRKSLTRLGSTRTRIWHGLFMVTDSISIEQSSRIKDSAGCWKSALPSREAILSSHRTWTGTFRRPVLRRSKSSNATAQFTTFNAPHPVLMKFGMQKVKP